MDIKDNADDTLDSRFCVSWVRIEREKISEGLGLMKFHSSDWGWHLWKKTWKAKKERERDSVRWGTKSWYKKFILLERIFGFWWVSKRCLSESAHFDTLFLCSWVGKKKIWVEIEGVLREIWGKRRIWEQKNKTTHRIFQWNTKESNLVTSDLKPKALTIWLSISITLLWTIGNSSF